MNTKLIPLNIDWEFSKPNFEYQKKFDDYYYPWAGHIYFCYDFIKNMKPGRIVELGTFKGTSFYSMLQAVKDDRLNSEVFAIDSWEGDEHAGFYGKDIYDGVTQIVREYYSNQNARLIKKYFDDALDEFEESTIDLLHIDGLHTYEAVKGDFEHWLPKLANEGTIFFHDIKVADFGVWKVWNELKNKYPDFYFLDFSHSYGLGVMTRSKKLKSIFSSLSSEEVDSFKKYYEERFVEELFPRFRTNTYELLAVNEELRKAANANAAKIDNLKNDITTWESKFNQIIKEFTNVLSSNDELRNHYDHAVTLINHRENELNNIRGRKFIKIFNSIFGRLGRGI
jgi:hypothetical protein